MGETFDNIVIDSARLETAREAKRTRELRNSDDKLRTVVARLPTDVLRTILLAFRDHSEERLQQLPPNWRDQALQVYRGFIFRPADVIKISVERLQNL